MTTTNIRRTVLAATALAAVLPAIAAAPSAATAGDAMDARYERYLEQEKQRNATASRTPRLEARGDQQARIGVGEYTETHGSWDGDDRGQHFYFDVPRSQEQHYRGR